MKKIISIFLILFSVYTYAQEVTISGKIINYSESDSLKLQIFSSQTPTEISIPVSKDGQFSLKTSCTMTSFAKIYFAPQDFILLILSPKEKITISANYNNLANSYKVEGSKQTELWNANNAEIMKYTQELQNKKTAYEKEADSIEKKKIEYVISFIKKNPTSLASLAVIEMLDITIYSDIYEMLDTNLIVVHRGNPIVENFHTSVKQAMFLKEGSIAPDIILTDQNGKQVALSSLKGKIVLIDFWASWCRPCRMEIPNLKNAYTLYHNKGFEIYSISIDNDKNAWTQALIQENMPWITVHDSQKVYSTMYNVTSIPNTLLINRDGSIIAKNVRGTALEEYLQQLLGK